jgi:hypothetical protein
MKKPIGLRIMIFERTVSAEGFEVEARKLVDALRDWREYIQ